MTNIVDYITVVMLQDRNELHQFKSEKLLIREGRRKVWIG
jgi:hypothetical protein